jgi:uncharacterized membrane protein
VNARRFFGPFFIFAGVMHFVIPRAYAAIVPPQLPNKRAVVYASGVAEIAGGAGVLHSRTRKAASAWSVATLLAVFPANVHMAINPEQVPGLDLRRVPRWALRARLPLQPLMMLWVWRATRD